MLVGVSVIYLGFKLKHVLYAHKNTKCESPFHKEKTVLSCHSGYTIFVSFELLLNPLLCPHVLSSIVESNIL